MAAEPVSTNATNLYILYNNVAVYSECEVYALDKTTLYSTSISVGDNELIVFIGTNLQNLPIYIKYDSLFYPYTVSSQHRYTVELTSITPYSSPYMDCLKINNGDKIEIHDSRISDPSVYLTDDTKYAASSTVGGPALKAVSIPYGQVDSTSTATAFTATVPGITELTNGICVLLKNGVITSASGFTININGLGAKPAFNNMTVGTAETTTFNINYTILFIYDSTRVVGSYTGAWCYYRGYFTDGNSVGYQLRTNSTAMPVSDRARYYKMYFTSADNTQWVPASSDWTNNATAARAVNQRPINPFGPIVYTSASTSYTVGTTLAASTAWQLYNLTLGYSFNRTGAALTLTINNPVYLKCAPLSNGSAIIDADNPIVQALPSTEDGKIYIYLGVATSATAMELRYEHPIFYYKDGCIRLWTNGVTFSGNYNDLTNKPTIPDDSGLVHKTGNETITGDKIFQSNIEITAPLSPKTLKYNTSEENRTFSWIVNNYDGGTYNLQQALDARNNPTNISAFTNDAGYLTAHLNISGKEDTSNKVTSLSSNSTDTLYPSAKCVYDIIGDIETLLQSI